MTKLLFNFEEDRSDIETGRYIKIDIVHRFINMFDINTLFVMNIILLRI